MNNTDELRNGQPKEGDVRSPNILGRPQIKRIAVVVGMCVGKCSECDCIQTIQEKTAGDGIGVINFSSSGKPMLTADQRLVLSLKLKK